MHQPTRTALVPAALALALLTGCSTAEGDAAPAEDRKALTEVGREHLRLRADLLTTERSRTALAAVATAPLTKGLREEFRADATELMARGDAHAKKDGGYREATVEVTVDTATVDGDDATLEVTEHTSLFFGGPADRDPAATEYVLRHELRFVRDGTGWLLDGERVLGVEGKPLPDTQLDTPTT
ncbi:hypothetical protein [Streptomyces sp. NPDC097619]|uniref:hypothetical protein n=1 Tax=Streptomyces sp. NPDC097619 TaxID=3157228 RepID=UPI00331896D4